MINIIIPLYNGENYLDNCLESIDKQTIRDFKVTLIQDGDGQDYTDIIEDFDDKFNINLIQLTNNVGTGAARQIGLDNSEGCDYVTFIDQDDVIKPTALEKLYELANDTEADVVYSSFIKEEDNKQLIIDKNGSFMTQLHGKLFSLDYINRINLSFDKNMRYAEDSYFNLVAFYCTEDIEYLDEITYIWKNNKNSVSRKDEIDYFSKMYSDYVVGQLNGLMKIYDVTKKVDPMVFITLVLNIYVVVMTQRYEKFEDVRYEETLKNFGEQEYIKTLFSIKQTWYYIASGVKGGGTFADDFFFFTENFLDWAKEWLDIDYDNLIEEDKEE